MLVNLLSGNETAGAWGVALSGGGSPSACEDDQGDAMMCFLVEPDYPDVKPTWATVHGERFPNLDVERVDTGGIAYNDELVLSGTFAASRGGTIRRVTTSLETCSSSTSATDCAGSTSHGSAQERFTTKTLPQGIDVAPGQSVSVTVEISFSSS